MEPVPEYHTRFWFCFVLLTGTRADGCNPPNWGTRSTLVLTHLAHLLSNGLVQLVDFFNNRQFQAFGKTGMKESSSIPGVRKKKKIRIKESSSIPGV
jgi:hypothetical protein